MYFGVIELERSPYVAVVKVIAPDDEAAKRKYEEYCDEIGGYIMNLYPSTPEVIERFGVAYECAKTI